MWEAERFEILQDHFRFTDQEIRYTEKDSYNLAIRKQSLASAIRDKWQIIDCTQIN